MGILVLWIDWLWQAKVGELGIWELAVGWEWISSLGTVGR